MHEKINEKSTVGTRTIPASDATLRVSFTDHRDGQHFHVAINFIEPDDFFEPGNNDADDDDDFFQPSDDDEQQLQLAGPASDDGAIPPVPLLQQIEVKQSIEAQIQELKTLKDNILNEQEDYAAAAADNINIAIQCLRNLIQEAPPQQQQIQNAAPPANPEEANFAFRDAPPPHFNTRVYPVNEPEENKNLRLILNKKVRAFSQNVHERLLTTNPLVVGAVRYRDADGRQIQEKLATLFVGNVPSTNVSRLFGKADEVHSEYIEILRAFQRLVNEKIVVNVLMSEPGATVDGIDKQVLAERFTHLSQRSFWHVRNLIKASDDNALERIGERIVNFF